MCDREDETFSLSEISFIWANISFIYVWFPNDLKP